MYTEIITTLDELEMNALEASSKMYREGIEELSARKLYLSIKEDLSKIVYKSGSTDSTNYQQRRKFEQLRQNKHQDIHEFRVIYDHKYEVARTSGLPVADERWLARDFIYKLDPLRYKKLIMDLENAELCDNSSFPDTLDKAVHIASHYKTLVSPGQNNTDVRAFFHQAGAPERLLASARVEVLSGAPGC